MGHGKTLNSIKEIDLRANKEGRKVYFHNIDGLCPGKLSAEWIEFEDPHKWFILPENSIIVIDEAQRFFPVRSPSAAVPDYCSEVETARHKGFDLNLITQDYRLLDVHLRRLCDSHIHYWRPFGLSSTSRYQFQKATNFDSMTERKDGQFTRVKLDKRYFDVYKSATNHNVKRQIPFKFMLLPVAIMVMLACVFYVYRFFAERAQPENEIAALPVKSASSTTFSGSLGVPIPVVDSVDRYLSDRVPRVSLLPSSAPVYDEISSVSDYPRLICITSKSSRDVSGSKSAALAVLSAVDVVSCQCYTQQGTRYQTPRDFCIDVAAGGVFDPGMSSRSSAPNGGASAPSAAASSSVVSVITDQEFAARPWRK